LYVYTLNSYTCFHHDFLLRVAILRVKMMENNEKYQQQRIQPDVPQPSVWGRRFFTWQTLDTEHYPLKVNAPLWYWFSPVFINSSVLRFGV